MAMSGRRALALAVAVGLSFSQAQEPPPTFLAEMSAKPRDTWTFEEVDGLSERHVVVPPREDPGRRASATEHEMILESRPDGGGWTAVRSISQGEVRLGKTSLPAVVESAGEVPPLWVSRGAVLGDDGEIVAPDLSNEAIATFARLVAQASPGASGDCVSQRPIVMPAVPAHERATSFSEAVAFAELVVAGRVTGRTVGFLQGEPGTMLEVEVDVWLENRGSHPERPFLYVFYPAAELAIAGGCVDYRLAGWPAAPGVGAATLVLPPIPQQLHDVAENLVVEAYIGLEVLFEDESGIVGANSLRTMLEISEARHLRQLIREVRRQRRQERRRDDG